MDTVTQREKLLNSVKTRSRDEEGTHCCEHFTAVEDNQFIPRGIYVGPDLKPIIFDSGYSITVMPYRQAFVGELSPVNKSILGLNDMTEGEGEGTINGYLDTVMIYHKW